MSALSRPLSARVERIVQRIADEATERVAAQLGARLDDLVRAEMRELSRMLRQQGDSADELAETFGRTLARLSVEVEALHRALDKLQGSGGTDRS